LKFDSFGGKGEGDESDNRDDDKDSDGSSIQGMSNKDSLSQNMSYKRPSIEPIGVMNLNGNDSAFSKKILAKDSELISMDFSR
jgi:hypothetical protein